ncbi:GntR family transcriptional regulator [Rhodococcus rhodochrous]|uniref:GntR family transcriptional regulator n=1 Tax=Rhodococcus rhodochrous TaxID=1829 RepID=UPI001E503E85|nr:GntR family transcriptional regulator [Rhodococcus rhodochrous]MCD2100253.1 GntR family transcriptional regulator [Rhodococcus rhodochrous]MCD2124611.1 GntR family transcriptional regulator [Rhodococcus rhodochrous]MCQ4137624.1 GntR family transcriptional regulator [Rhodococcus rhodochrous]MDJ0021407.1 GntR family transcriptional regulator [Rhodococcus rhodochrous]
MSPTLNQVSNAPRYDEFRRRTFTTTKMLHLENDLLRDEARRLRDLLSFYVVPRLDESRRMPSEDELAREFHCSRNSARAALKLLANEQSIQRVTGVGTYAREAPKRWRSDMLRDSPSYKAEHAAESTLVGWHVEYETPVTMKDTFAADVSRLAVFEKRQTYQGVPGLLRTFFVPLRPQDTLGPEDASEDLLSILEDRFDHRPLRAERIITAIAADESAATQLEVPVGSPLLFIQTAVYGKDGSLVLLYFVRQRGEVVQLSVEPERVL